MSEDFFSISILVKLELDNMVWLNVTIHTVDAQKGILTASVFCQTVMLSEDFSCELRLYLSSTLPMPFVRIFFYDYCLTRTLSEQAPSVRLVQLTG